MVAPEETSRTTEVLAAIRSNRFRRRAGAVWRRVRSRYGDHRGQPASRAKTAPVNTFPPLVAELRHLRWSDDGNVVLDGWCYLPSAVSTDAKVRIFATAGGSERNWLAEVEQRSDPEIGVVSTRGDDLTDKGWTATFPSAALAGLLRDPQVRTLRDATGARTWLLQVWIELDFGTKRQVSPLTSHYAGGSAAGLPGRVVDDSWWISASWQDGRGLVFAVQTDCVAAVGLGLGDSSLNVQIAALGSAQPRRVHVGGKGGEQLEWPAGQGQGRWPVAASKLSAKGPTAVSWTAQDRSRHAVLASQPPITVHGYPDFAVDSPATGDGHLLLRLQRRLAQLDDVRLVDGPTPSLRLAGALAGPWSGPLTIELRGDHHRMATTTDSAEGRFSVDLPMLHTDAWGNAGLAPPTGDYRLWVGDGDGSEVAVLSSGLTARLYEWAVTELFTARLERHVDGGLGVVVGDSRPLTEVGPAARRRLRARYTDPSAESTAEEAIYFESFDGLVCACNPKAVYDEIRRRNLGLTLYWGVKDRSVPVPAGATPVTINSAEWWRVRHQARYLVANNWVHSTWTRHPHQKVLQTWHGTAFKLLALDRPQARHDPKFAAAVRAEQSRWDILLAENDYSVQQMRQAYEYSGPILPSGYPRNDLLTTPAAEQVRKRLRARLGLSDEQQAVLYAPTWRDDREDMVDHLDLPRLAAELGEDFVILARGHSRTLRTSAARDSERVIDVSSYPEVTDLFCAADLCVTDYSSVMFDFTVTGKPVLFYTPDYEQYVGESRGSYFDLRETAPGPLLSRLDETAEAIASADTIRQSWDPQYRAWVAKFNAWDDGGASARAADALLAE